MKKILGSANLMFRSALFEDLMGFFLIVTIIIGLLAFPSLI